MLSHYSCEHFQYLSQSHFPPLYNARQHPHVLYYPHITLPFAGSRMLLRVRLPSLPCAFTVLDALFIFSLFGVVVRDTPLRGTSFTVRFPAAKGAAQVFTARVTRMSKEEYPAMPATLQALPQMGMGSQNRPQHDIILKDEGAGLALTVPVRPKLKMPPDGYNKKPRFSLRMLMVSEPVRLTAEFLVLFILT